MHPRLRLLLAGGLAAAGLAHAGPNLNTGLATGGSVLAAGSIDPYWTISTDGSHFTAARVAYPGAYPDYGSGQICCGMESVDGSAAWITTPSVVATSPTTGWGTFRNVFARRAFDLSGYDLASVGFSGRWRVADLAFGIYVNGHLVAGTNTGSYAFGGDQAFSVAAGSGVFLPGMNVVELRGQSVNDVWDAFYLTGAVSGTLAPVPEPETYALMLAGLGLLGTVARRRR